MRPGVPWNVKGIEAELTSLSNAEETYKALCEQKGEQILAEGGQPAVQLQDIGGKLNTAKNERQALRKSLQIAKGLTERYLSVEEQRAKIRRSYVAPFSKAIPGRTLARFYQIENKIDAVVRFEAAAEIPLVPAK